MFFSQHNKGQYRVYIHKQSINSLAIIVKPHMDPSFLYKLGLTIQPKTISLSSKGCSRQLGNVRHISSSALINSPAKYVVPAAVRSFSTLSAEDSLSPFAPPPTILGGQRSRGGGAAALVLVKKNFASYLAGLIDASGTIAVHSKESNAKKYLCPKFIVVFNSADEPLAKRLAFITGTGTVYNKKNAGYVI